MPVMEVTCVSSPCALMPYRLPANREATRSTTAVSACACSSVAIRSALSTMSKACDRSRAKQIPPSSWVLPMPNFNSRLVPAVPLACSSNVGDVLYGSPQGIRETAMGLIRKLGDVP